MDFIFIDEMFSIDNDNMNNSTIYIMEYSGPFKNNVNKTKVLDRAEG